MKKLLLLTALAAAGLALGVAYAGARRNGEAAIETGRLLGSLADSAQRVDDGVLKLKAAVVTSHDGIVGAVSDSRTSLRLLAGMPGHAETAAALAACAAALDAKEAMAGRIRSAHAVLKNSLDYLPEIERQLLAAGTLGTAGERTIKDLVRDALIYERTQDGAARASAEDAVRMLSELRKDLVPPFRTDLELFLAHTGRVLEGGESVTRDLKRLDAVPLRARVEDLRAALGAHFAGLEQRRTLIGSLLAGYGLLLFAGILGSLAAARKGAGRLLRERERLELAIQARTRELADREAESRAVLEGVGEGVLSLDGDGRIRSANAAAERMFGRPAAELQGRLLGALVTAPWTELKAGRTRREIDGIRADESSFPLEIWVSELALEGRTAFSATLRNLTESKRIESMKNDFISTVSHELRTPLTSVRGALGLVAAGHTGVLPEKAKFMIDLAAKNCERLVGLVNDILDIEKIVSGKMVFRPRPVELVTFLAQALETHRPFAQAHGVALDFERSVEEARILADPDRLAQVLANLVSNACKYSPKDGTVLLALERRGAGYRVSVADRGPGIPEEFRSRIFQRFAQAESLDQRKGTGLGLAITKSLVENMGGSLGFESEVGRGSTFHFEFPADDPRPAAAPAADAVDGRPRILVCEDEVDIARVLAAMLDAQGFDAEIAGGLAQARKALSERSFAAMTLDLMLPDGDAMSFLGELRKDPRNAELPVVIVSACLEEKRDGLSGGAAGVVDWLEKPIREERLKSALDRALRGTGERKPRILHVEDDVDIRRVLAGLVGDAAEIAAEGTVLGAWERLKAEDFDLLILDVGLPDGSGLELLPALHRTTRAPIPSLVFSAHELSPRFSSQVSDVLLKSKATNAELMDRVRRLLRNPVFGPSQVPTT